MEEPIVNFLEHCTLKVLYELLEKYGTLTDFTSGRVNISSIKDKIFVGHVFKVGPPLIRTYTEDEHLRHLRPSNRLAIWANNLVGDKEQSKQAIRIIFVGKVVRELLNENIQENDVIAILNPRLFHVNYSNSTQISLSIGPVNAVLWICRNLVVEKCNPTVGKKKSVSLGDINSDDSFADPEYVPENQSSSSVSTTRPKRKGLKKTTSLAEDETICDSSEEHSESDLSVSVANNNRYRALPIDLEKVNGSISNSNLIQQEAQNISNKNCIELQQMPIPTTSNNKALSKNTQKTDVTLCENRNILPQNTDSSCCLEGDGSRKPSNERANCPEHSCITKTCSQLSHSNCMVQRCCCASRQFRCRLENSCSQSFHNFCHRAHYNCLFCNQSCQFKCPYHSLEKISSCVNACQCPDNKSSLGSRNMVSSAGKPSGTQIPCSFKHCQPACACMKSCCFNWVCSPGKISCCNYQKSVCLPETSCHAVIPTCCCNCSGISKISCCRNKDKGNLQQSFNHDSTNEMERITRTENWVDQCIPHSPGRELVPIDLDSSSSSNPSNRSSQFQDFIIVSSGKVASNQSNNRHMVEPIIPPKKRKLFNALEHSGIISERSPDLAEEERVSISSGQFTQQPSSGGPCPISNEPIGDIPDSPLNKSTKNVTERPLDRFSKLITETPQNQSNYITKTSQKQSKEIITENPPKKSSDVIMEVSPRQSLEVITETPSKKSTEVITEAPSGISSDVITETQANESTKTVTEVLPRISSDGITETQANESTTTVTEILPRISSDGITEFYPKESTIVLSEALPRKSLVVIPEVPLINYTEGIIETPQEHVVHISNETIGLEKPHQMQTDNVEGSSLIENENRESAFDLSEVSAKSTETIDLEQEKSVEDNVNISTASSEDTFHDAHSTETLSEKSRPSPSEQWTIRDVNEISAYATSAKKLFQQNVTVPQSHPLTFRLYQVYPVKAVIINMIPGPENISLLIRGMCHGRCGCSIYYGEFDEMKKLDVPGCKICKYRTHFACPVCHKDGVEKPLCIFYSFELHLLINKIVLRVELDHADAVNFLGSAPSVYLRAFKKFSQKLRNIIYDSSQMDSIIFLNANIKPRKKNGVTILTLFNTTLSKNLEQNGSLFIFPIIK